MARMQLDLASTGQLSPESGSSDALYNLGLMYSAGTEVEPNLVMAHKWFNLAAMKGSDAARSYRAELAQEMSKEEIAEAQRQAREWLANQ